MIGVLSDILNGSGGVFIDRLTDERSRTHGEENGFPRGGKKDVLRSGSRVRPMEAKDE